MTRSNPSITVITAVLNACGKIGRTIDSIRRQEYEGLQYIVVDGGSADGTLELLKANQKVVTSWTSEPDRGISDAFNKGVARSSGEIIGILNAGDWYEPEALSVVAGAAAEHPEVDVICGSIRLWENQLEPLQCYADPESLDFETSVYHPAVFIRKSAYRKFGDYDESCRFAMDYELLLRFKRRGAKFLSILDTLANMRLDGISSKHWYKGLAEVRKARSKYFSPANVAYGHARAVAMNLAARTLKRTGLSSVYRAYREDRNKKYKVGR